MADKKVDPLLVTVIVLVIISAVLFIIALVILFVYGSRDDLLGVRNQILASGGMIAIAAPLAIVSAILTGVLIKNRSKGKNPRGTFIAALVLSILTGILVLISGIIIFVTANQIQDTNPDEATGLRAAAALMLIGFVLFIVAFFMFIARARAKLPEDVRKERTTAFFRSRNQTKDA